MSKDKLPTETANEGEGNITAAREYNKKTEEFVASGKVKEAAKKAEEALEGPEGDDLRAARRKARPRKQAA